MESVTHQEKCDIAYDDGGRPTVSITFYNQTDNNTVPDGFDNILLDTGAVVTSINKAFADENNYPIISHRELVLMGFNDIGRAMKALTEFMSKEDASVYLKSFADRGKDLVDALERDYGITNIGLVFDLRKISYVEICGHIVQDAIIATLSDDNVLITDVLGMNILEKFNVSLNMSDNYLLLDINNGNSRVKNILKCGSAFVQQEQHMV